MLCFLWPGLPEVVRFESKIAIYYVKRRLHSKLHLAKGLPLEPA